MNFLKKAAKKTFDKVQQQINDDHDEEEDAGPTDYEGRFNPEKRHSGPDHFDLLLPRYYSLTLAIDFILQVKPLSPGPKVTNTNSLRSLAMVKTFPTVEGTTSKSKMTI